MSKSCILLGANSDIGRALAKLLIHDGWQVWGWARGQTLKLMPAWNLVLCAIGQVAPVGHWADIDAREWESAVDANVLLPVRLLRELWARREPDSAVCFLAGSNPQRVFPNYTAYATGKMALLKAVEHMDYESPDCKMFALAPGFVNTKIHAATHAAGVPNPRIEQFMARNDAVPIERIYGCLKWCLAQPKEVIGGRNICASDRWEQDFLAEMLAQYPGMYKLRRYGDDK